MEQPGGFGKMVSSATSPPLVPVAPGGLVGRGLGVLDRPTHVPCGIRCPTHVPCGIRCPTHVPCGIRCPTHVPCGIRCPTHVPCNVAYRILIVFDLLHYSLLSFFNKI